MGSNVVDPFVRVSMKEDCERLINVLRQRLPTSAHEYNLLLMTTRHPRDDVYIYVLDGDFSENAVILLLHYRKDFGQDIAMSISKEYEPGPALKQVLLETKAVDWRGPFYITSIDRRIGRILVDISAEMKNATTYNPCYQFVYDPEEALKLDFSDIPGNIQLKPLDKEVGAKFLTKNWKWTTNGTVDFVEGLLDHYPSVGIYVDGVLASAGIVIYHGLTGLLHTDKNYRRRGLAQLCMKYLFKEMAKIGLIPCSSCQIENIMSREFHKKLGMTLTHETDYILHRQFSENAN